MTLHEACDVWEEEDILSLSLLSSPLLAQFVPLASGVASLLSYLQLLLLFLTLHLALRQGLRRLLLEQLRTLGLERVQLGLAGQFRRPAVGAQLQLTEPACRRRDDIASSRHVRTLTGGWEGRHNTGKPFVFIETDYVHLSAQVEFERARRYHTNSSTWFFQIIQMLTGRQNTTTETWHRVTLFIFYNYSWTSF